MGWRINPSNQEVALLMEAGILYRDLKKYQEASDIFKGVRALLPNSEIPEVALGTVAFERGNFEGAERHYRRALDLNPRSAWAYAHLGELALFQANKEQARAFLNTAIDLDPRGDYGKLARALLDLVNVVRFQ
jgi:tetratricopeptide (TPR) repeat protein